MVRRVIKYSFFLFILSNYSYSQTWTTSNVDGYVECRNVDNYTTKISEVNKVTISIEKNVLKLDVDIDEGLYNDGYRFIPISCQILNQQDTYFLISKESYMYDDLHKFGIVRYATIFMRNNRPMNIKFIQTQFANFNIRSTIKDFEINKTSISQNEIDHLSQFNGQNIKEESFTAIFGRPKKAVIHPILDWR